jgi:hypothetical protein
VWPLSHIGVRIYRLHPKPYREKEKKPNRRKILEKGTHVGRCRRKEMVMCSDSATVVVVVSNWPLSLSPWPSLLLSPS